MKKRNNIFLLLMLAFVQLLASCEAERISGVMCDESMRRVLEDELEIFAFQYEEGAEITPVYTGESEAMDSLLNKKAALAITSSDLTETQKKILKSQGRAYRSRLIAVDAIAVIVNNDNACSSLMEEELSDILQGKHRTWIRYSSNRTDNDTIRLYFDRSTSAVLHYLRNRYLDGNVIPFDVYSVGSSAEVFEAVKKRKNAIGFVGVSWLGSGMDRMSLSTKEKMQALSDESIMTKQQEFSDLIKVLSILPKNGIDAVKPYQEYINSGEYPLVRKIYAIDSAPLVAIEHKLFVFITSQIGQKIILQSGIMPGNVPVRIVEVQE